jgi:thymidine kinase
MECICVTNLSECNIDSYNTIIIDEGQFFSDLKEKVTEWVDNKIHVIVAGLDGDFQRNPIGQILELIPYSDVIIKLNSLCGICVDGTEAPFTRRKNSSKDKILVGGNDIYVPVCRKHYTN